jgi:hypothetical protein
MSTLVDIADELFRELDEPDDASIASISYWLTSNIGKLNGLLDIEISVENNELVPELDNDQKVVFKKLYEIHYYQRQIKKNLGAAAYTAFSEVKEGNRTVRRVNKNEIAKTYKLMVTDLNDELTQLLMAYRMNRADPMQLYVPNPIHEEDYASDTIMPNYDNRREY